MRRRRRLVVTLYASVDDMVHVDGMQARGKDEPVVVWSVT